MSTLSCHVYYDHTDQNAPYWVSIGLLTCTSHLTAITFHQVSPNPMAVPKSILLHLKKRPQRTFSQKLIWIKTSFFEKVKVKVQWWPLTQTLWNILDDYTKWKRILRATSGENCRRKGQLCSKLWSIKCQGVSRNIDFLTGSNSEAIRTKIHHDPWGSCFFLCWFDMEWPVY